MNIFITATFMICLPLHGMKESNTAHWTHATYVVPVNDTTYSIAILSHARPQTLWQLWQYFFRRNIPQTLAHAQIHSAQKPVNAIESNSTPANYATITFNTPEPTVELTQGLLKAIQPIAQKYQCTHILINAAAPNHRPA